MRARAAVTKIFFFAFLIAVPLFLTTARVTTLAIIPKSPSEAEAPPAQQAPPPQEAQPATGTQPVPEIAPEQEVPPATGTQPAPETPPALEEPPWQEPQHLLSEPPTPEAPPAQEVGAGFKPAPTPAPEALPPQYMVRTRSFLNRDDLNPLKQALLDAGYFPFIREEKIESEGDTLYFIELGSFVDLKSALPLFKDLRSAGIPVFLYSLGEPAPPADAPILPPALAEQFFPELRTAGIDRLELVMEIADGRRTEPLPSPGVAAAPGKDAFPAPVFAPRPPHKTVQPVESPVRKRLRDMAWQMREKGYSVFLEGETELSPEGVLVGVFDNNDDATDLADELGSYGYDMRVLKETRDGTAYYVYVDTKGAATSPGISTTIPAEGATEQDPFDFLLDMTLPR